MDDQEAFSLVQSRLSAESQQTLLSTVFKHLTYSGSDHFIASLLTQYLSAKKEQGCDALGLAARLTDKCPSFFTSRHFDVYKAEQLLERASRAGLAGSRSDIVREATSLLMANVGLADIDRVFPLLVALEQYSSAIKLALQASVESRLRDRCYELVMKLLGDVHAAALGKPGVGAELERVPVDRLNEMEELLIQEAVRESKDECFHLALFRWMEHEKMLDQLVNVRSPFLETYLQNKLDKVSSAKPSEFLYQYLMATKQYEKACEALYKIATGPGAETAEGGHITLEGRIEYMNVAMVCAERLAQEDGKCPRENFRQRLEKCKNALQMQLEISHALKEAGRTAVSDKEAKEDILKAEADLEAKPVLDPMELYEGYAKRFELWDVAIKILASGAIEGDFGAQLAELGEDYRLLLEKLYTESPKDWPHPAISQLSELARLYCQPQPEESKWDRKGRALFPVEVIVRQAETLNARHYEVQDESALAQDQSVEACVNRPEFWVPSFLRSDSVGCRYLYHGENHVNTRFEDIWEIYDRLCLGPEMQDGKWRLRIEMLKLVTTIMWGQAVREASYPGTTSEACIDRARASIRTSSVRFSRDPRIIEVVQDPREDGASADAATFPRTSRVGEDGGYADGWRGRSSQRRPVAVPVVEGFFGGKSAEQLEQTGVQEHE